MEAPVAGLSWVVDYTGVPLGAKAFRGLRMVQCLQDRVHATHTFYGGEDSGGEPVLQQLKESFDGKDVKFKVFNSDTNEGAEHEHHVTYTELVTSRGAGFSTLIVRSIDKASWTLMQGARFRGVKGGGKLEDTVSSVFSGVGVGLDVKVTTEAVPEFDVLYQPGISDYDFLYRHVMPRFPGTVTLTPSGNKFLLSDVSDFPEWEVDGNLVTKVKDIHNGGDAHRILGGRAAVAWMDPYTGRQKEFGMTPPLEIPGTEGTLAFQMPSFNSGEGVSSVFSGTNSRRSWYKPKVVYMEGISNVNGDPVAPAYKLKCKSHEVEGIVSSITHTIEGAKYSMILGLWSR